MGKVILSRTMRYRGGVIKNGTPIDVTAAEEREFTAKGYATRYVEPKKAAPAAPASMAAAPAPMAQVAKPSTVVGATTLNPGTYDTRDLKAKP